MRTRSRANAAKLPEHLRWDRRPFTSPESRDWLDERMAWMLAHGYGKLDALRRSEADQ